MTEPTVELTPRCHCRQYDPISIPASSFPLYGSACHCRLCAQCTGTLCVHFTQLPQGYRVPETTVKRLTAYSTSDTLVRYFCGTCGAHVAIYNTSPLYPVHWSLASGAIPAHLPSGAPVTKQAEHIFVQPEDGGGVARFFVDGLPRWTGDVGSEHATESQWATQEPAPKRVPLSCACGDFRAELVRPSELYDAKDVPEKPIETAWKRCVKDDKWRYIICPCESCRITSGFPFVTFFGILNNAIRPVPGSQGIAGLVKYQSSDDVTRYHCGRCGASVLYKHKDKAEIGLHDLFAGVVAGPLGPIMKEWAWRPPSLWQARIDDADDKKLAETLVKGWENAK